MKFIIITKTYASLINAVKFNYLFSNFKKIIKRLIKMFIFTISLMQAKLFKNVFNKLNHQNPTKM